MADASFAGSSLIPGLRYKDAWAAMEFLERALGFVRHAVFAGEDGTVQHAEMRHGSGMLMLGSASNPSLLAEWMARPEEIAGRSTASMYLVVGDCEAVWKSARAAGAEVVAELRSMDYGGRSFTVRDPEGYVWSVGEYDPWQVVETAKGDESASKGK